MNKINKTPSLYKAPEKQIFSIDPKLIIFGSLIIFFIIFLSGGIVATDFNYLLNCCL